MAHGRYIALEGAEGCGKSTQAERLAQRLGAVLTRETGGTPIGRRIREILHDTSVTDLSARSEALLTAADRAQHIAQVVRPALAAGRHVVSDRSVYSTLAYQGFGRGLAIDEVRRINDWAIDGCWPEVVLLIDVDPQLLAERMAGRELDRFERETVEFHERVRTGFRRLADAEADRWIVIDGSGPADRVEERIALALADRVGP